MSGPPLTAEAERERLEVEELLPWHATGRLSATERARVEAYLATHPEMARAVATAEAEREASLSLHEAAGAPSADGLRRLMRSIDALGPERASLLDRVHSTITNALDWLSAHSALVPVTAAAAVLLVLQSGTIAALLWARPVVPPTPMYETAAAPKAVADAGTYVLVGFAPSVSLQQVEQALQPLGITIADGPRAGGVYRLRLSQQPLEEAERDMLLTALKANRSVIAFVAPAGP